jgi:hypothetical protein
MKGSRATTAGSRAAQGDGRAIGETDLKGRYWLQKFSGGEWINMSAGEPRETAPGHELDHMIRQARVIGGRCRIVRQPRGEAFEIMWPESELE